jgi:hypothetical protein
MRPRRLLAAFPLPPLLHRNVSKDAQEASVKGGE